MEYGRCRDMNRTFILIMLSGTFFSAVSQILLKQSANIRYENRIREYLNFRVILSYTIYMLILLLNTWCYTKVDMRYGPVIDTAAYVFVLSFHSEGKNHERKNHGKPDHHCRYPDLYALITAIS